MQKRSIIFLGNDMISQILKKLGLNETEIPVYLTILQHGKISAAHLSKLTKINRTTIYSITKQLVKHGIIAEDLSTNKRQFIARPPQDLDILLRRQEHEIEEKRYLLENAMSDLEKLAKTAQYSIPKIVFIEEDELKEYLYSQTSEWNKSILQVDGIWWGFQDPTFVEHYPEWIDWYWQQTEPLDISLRLLTTESKVEEEMKKKNYPKRTMKFWKGGEGFTASTWINGDHLIMIMTNQRPHYLVEIHDKVLAHNMRKLLKGIWSSV
jgi:sugar-specific transcriptional regulator TrmB